MSWVDEIRAMLIAERYKSRQKFNAENRGAYIPMRGETECWATSDQREKRETYFEIAGV